MAITHNVSIFLNVREKEYLLLLEKVKTLKGKFILTINDYTKVIEWYKKISRLKKQNYCIQFQEKQRLEKRIKNL